MKPTGPSNMELRKLIVTLNKKKEPLWKRVSKELAKPTRQRRSVNLSRINTNTNDGETALIPGKVLGTGEITKKIKVAGWQFSSSAKEKIEKAGGKALSLSELAESYKKGFKVRIIG